MAVMHQGYASSSRECPTAILAMIEQDGQDLPGRRNKPLTNPLPNQKNFWFPLELLRSLQIFLIAADDAAGVPIGPRESRRAPEGVRCQLVPNLLFGGLGYEV
jgi:hypothetical protein